MRVRSAADAPTDDAQVLTKRRGRETGVEFETRRSVLSEVHRRHATRFSDVELLAVLRNREDELINHYARWLVISRPSERSGDLREERRMTCDTPKLIDATAHGRPAGSPVAAYGSVVGPAAAL